MPERAANPSPCLGTNEPADIRVLYRVRTTSTESVEDDEIDTCSLRQTLC
jgi:hypothetical protein